MGGEVGAERAGVDLTVGSLRACEMGDKLPLSLLGLLCSRFAFA